MKDEAIILLIIFFLLTSCDWSNKDVEDISNGDSIASIVIGQEEDDGSEIPGDPL